MDDSPLKDVPIAFPLGGLDVTRAFVRQTQETTPEGENVRAFDRFENRKRGGSRSGVERWIDTQMPGVIQGLGAVVATGEQFVIGYFPFHWPSFVLDPTSFAPIRFGGSGFPALPKIVPTLAWVPSETTLFEDEAFAVGHLDATASNPATSLALPGTFSYDVGLGELFGHTDERTVTATFTPTDATTFRAGQAVFTFKRKQKPTYVDWTPASPQTQHDPISGVLTAGGKDKADNSAVPGTVTYTIWYFDPDSGDRVTVGFGDDFDVATTYYFRAFFRPIDEKRYHASRKEATVTVQAGGGSGTGPYTFLAMDLIPELDPIFAVTSTVHVFDSINVEVSRYSFTEDDATLWEALTEGGYSGSSPAPGPVTVTVGNNMVIDGGGQGTWHYS